MLFLLVLICLCQINNSESKGKNGTLAKKYFGPSYQPTNWFAPTAFKILKSDVFSYDEQSEWPLYFQQCGGKRQSPINIETEELIKRKTKKPLKWSNYSELPKRMLIRNSLHSIHISGIWKSSETPFITYGPFENRYYFSQLHFHWGLTDEKGSEHTVNKKSYPLEMHVVHDRRMENLDNSRADENNLAVVAYMFEIVKADNPGLTAFLEGIPKVAGNEVKEAFINPFELEQIVETFHGKYVTYSGSLTTPPCTENVTWIISSKPIGISEKQMDIIRYSIRSYDNEEPIKNYRKVQPLNQRKVYYIVC